MAKKKYYAVLNGKVPGIYETWDACKAQVHGFPGAIYKSFGTRQEAQAYLGDEPGQAKEEVQPLNENSGADAAGLENGKPVSDAEHAVAYVDGSYHAAKHIFSYGVVMFWNGEEKHFSQRVDDDTLVDMRNVAGEICGSRAAMQFALEHGCKELVIYHDYEGIARWPLGQWKTNKEGTAAYKAYYDSIKDRLKVKFVKVKGHSNDKYNDLADELAKAAIF